MTLVALLIFFVPLVRASSPQAYQDYQYQYDVYRQRTSDFRIAFTQYQQFKSLASQQDTLDKAKLLLAQRSNVAKTYFLFLNERLTENPGLISSELSLYRSIITNQVGFLDQNLVLTPSISSLDDAAKVSETFDANYDTLQSANRQIIGAIELGYLNYFSKRFDDAAVHAQALIAASRSDFSPQKQGILDRWLLSLSNKHSLYQQKASAIRSAIPKIIGDVGQQDRLFLELQIKIGAARQDLLDAASYLKEIETALKYD